MAAVIDDLRARQHADGVHQLLLQRAARFATAHCQGSTETWMAPGAPCPPTDLIA